MAPKFRNIVIFAAIGGALIVAYFLFVQPYLDSRSEQPGLVTSVPSASLPEANGVPAGATAGGKTPMAASDFLALLLSVKNIKLNNAIFSDSIFGSLRDSSIILEPDGTEGRPNPFARFETTEENITPTPAH